MEDPMKALWRKSSYSGNGGGNCVEVADAACTVAVRDSKDGEGPRLAIPDTQWRAFLARVQGDS
ncbi:MAG TPA: DUF397 domain-containing protein [Streptosporangiaceae bacterium]|jgi:hypothetical protein|nr:DUF397 domain-containing protein [Streptosporangiaceae bacterium]